MTHPHDTPLGFAQAQVESLERHLQWLEGPNPPVSWAGLPERAKAVSISDTRESLRMARADLERIKSAQEEI